MPQFRNIVLLGVPLCEMVCGQIQGLWAPRLGPLSLAQAYHCIMLCVVSLYLVSCLRRRAERPLVIDACLAVFLLTAGVSTAMAMRHNSNFSEDIIAFSQILYWILMWLIYAEECSTAEGRRLVLTGVFTAGVYMSVSVIVLFLVGGEAYSRYEGVGSSFGGFSTAKSLGGILCVAALLSLCIRSASLQATLLCVSVTALLLTYQRAGQLAMLAAILWMVGVRVASRVKASLLSSRSIAAFACALLVGAAFVDTEALSQRWNNADLTLGDKAGSGRLGLWNDALRAFETMNWPGKMLGAGYSGMREAMLEEGMGGNRKHTHSDALDILLAFGVLGMLGWIAIHYAMIQTIRARSKTSTEYVVGGAVYVVFLVESLVTGQVFGPATMIVYVGAITALCRVGKEMRASTCSVPIAGDRLSPSSSLWQPPAWAHRLYDRRQGGCSSGA